MLVPPLVAVSVVVGLYPCTPFSSIIAVCPVFHVGVCRMVDELPFAVFVMSRITPVPLVCIECGLSVVPLPCCRFICLGMFTFRLCCSGVGVCPAVSVPFVSRK